MGPRNPQRGCWSAEHLLSPLPVATLTVTRQHRSGLALEKQYGVSSSTESPQEAASVLESHGHVCSRALPGPWVGVDGHAGGLLPLCAETHAIVSARIDRAGLFQCGQAQKTRWLSGPLRSRAGLASPSGRRHCPSLRLGNQPAPARPHSLKLTSRELRAARDAHLSSRGCRQASSTRLLEFIPGASVEQFP